jgi:hypothetical protein
MSSWKFLAPLAAARMLALSDCRAIDGALKCAATKAKATANQLQLLPGSMNLIRPLQSQRLSDATLRHCRFSR